VEEKTQSGRGLINPDKAGSRARDKVKAAEAAQAKEQIKKKDKRSFKKGEWSCHLE
jgi:hypothetical protein